MYPTQIIILPLTSNVLNSLYFLEHNKDQKLLDIESVLSFILYAFSNCSDLKNTLTYSIDSFKTDFLLNEPEIILDDIINTLDSFKNLIVNFYSNLEQYGIVVNNELQYDFCSFLTEGDIILRKA